MLSYKHKYLKYKNKYLNLKIQIGGAGGGGAGHVSVVGSTSVAVEGINLDKYVITNYWSKLLPNLKTSRSTIEISSIIALEGLNVAGIFTVKLTNLIVLTILESERILSL